MGSCNSCVLVEMTDRGLLDLWWIDSERCFHGIEMCLEPWVRYCFHQSVVFTVDKELLLERARQLNGDVKIWDDFDWDRKISLYCVTIHPKGERLEWMHQG